jgi:prepilin-type N-terminal cleavage/methylation domain-containing protein
MFKVNRKLSQRGFSLIELMVAAAILAMAIFGIFQAYSTGFMGMADAKYRTVATNIAREKMEEIKNTSFVDSSTDSDTVSGINFTTTVDVNPIEANLSNVITIVTWLDRKGDQKEIKLEMLVYDLQTSSSAVTVGSINLSADPTNVICCIGETSTITAIIRDTAGNLVPGGTMVSFITSSGTLSADSATTWGSTGTATVTLTVGSTVATVTAFIGAVSDTVTIICTLPNINVEAVPSALASCEISTITATLTDASNNPIANQAVGFSTDKGTLSNDNATTNESGKAIVTLTSGYEVMATVVASFCGETSNTTIHFTTPDINVSADPEVIALDTEITTSTITATVTDASGNPVKDKIIEFTTDDGVLNGGTNTASVPTDNTGIATVVLSNTSVGEATVQASYCSVTGEVGVITKLNSGSGYIIVSAEPKEIIANGTSTSTITATIYDENDNILTGYDKDITFTTTPSGTFSNGSDTIILTSADYSGGVATVVLTSSTTSGTVDITVSSDILTLGSTTVTFYSNEPDHIELTANPVLVHGGESEVTAIIKKGSHTITAYVGTVDFSITEGGEYAYFLGSNPVDVNNGKAYRTLKTIDEALFPAILKVYAFSTFINSENEVVTIEGEIDVPIVKIVIQLKDPPDITCDTGCTKVSFKIEVFGWGEDHLTVEKMRVTWPSGLINGNEKLTEIRITGQSGWEPAWADEVTAGTDAYIYQRLSSGGPYTLDMSFVGANMSGKTIEVAFYTDKGDFLMEVEVIASE